jgi:hypothetical protein
MPALNTWIHCNDGDSRQTLKNAGSPSGYRSSDEKAMVMRAASSSLTRSPARNVTTAMPGDAARIWSAYFDHTTDEQNSTGADIRPT